MCGKVYVVLICGLICMLEVGGVCVLILWGMMVQGPELARSLRMGVFWWFCRHRGCGG